MPMQASSDRDLARAGNRQRETGSRLLLLGGILYGIALILWQFDGNLPAYAGAVLASLALIPSLAGIGLMASSFVAKRSAQRKPFA